MNEFARPFVDRLARFRDTLASVTAGWSSEQAHWRPTEGAWSLVEIVGHLLDEERDDFRPRLRLTLADPGAAWPPIDPEGAVLQRRHQERQLDELLAEWRSERDESLAWLRSLAAPRWENTYEHPAQGPLRAGDMLVSWTNHDVLHLRQISKWAHRRNDHEGAPFTSEYAGPF